MDEQTPTDAIKVALEWHLPESIITRWANNLVVQTSEQDFILSFFELRPPFVLGSPEEQRSQLEKLGSVRAEGVARIVVPARKMGEFIEVLTQQWERYQSSLETSE